MDVERMRRVNELSNEVRAYIARYRTGARQLATGEIGWEWWKTGVPVEQAIAYANDGYLPGEATTLKAYHVPPYKPGPHYSPNRADDATARRAYRSTGDRGAAFRPPPIGPAGRTDVQLPRSCIRMASLGDHYDTGRPSTSRSFHRGTFTVIVS